ncbi:neuropeptide FF receptor 1-like [Hydractinia symbiolongicarpus]|uniref:neuropeptide FF receptor 1-like n=1 Tax=Hydractinia symbiolongicarpus TaxID=13093 RepID=UPI00254AA9EF|nr:neuropeptide FF receptor 1-like [Hydractinia symbiolongicarpus]
MLHPRIMNVTNCSIEVDKAIESMVYVKLTFYIVSFIVSVIGNILVIIVMLHKSIVTSFSLALAHLALCDLIVGTGSIIEAQSVLNNSLWYSTVLACKLGKGIVSISFLSSTQAMTLIALERRNKVVTPLSNPWTHKRIILSVIIIWLISIVVYSPYISWLTVEISGRCTFTSALSKKSSSAYVTILFLLKYVIPLTIMALCYGSTIKTLYRRPIMQQRQSISGTSITQVGFHTKEAKRVFKTLIFSLLAFTIMTLPSPVYWLVIFYTDTEEGERPAALIETLAVLYYVHSGVNPLIYLFFNKTFRKDSLSTLRKFTCWQQKRVSASRETNNIVIKPTPGSLSVERY